MPDHDDYGEDDDYEEDDSHSDVPWYEAEDIGCSCTENGIESEWEWNSIQGCYICVGCGEIQ